jgi:prevent-host-death family protein
MRSQYSIYDAKTRLSEIIRLVKRHHRVTITDRGRPVAEIVPLAQAASLKSRLAALEEAGEVLPARNRSAATALRAVAKRPGALRRFLVDRD